jgi:hypothetical protein
MTTELEAVTAALAANQRENDESMARMDRHRREGVARDLRAGRRVLRCHCPECLQKALSLELPNPRACLRARSMILAGVDRDGM